jgi:hypothetical protein
MIAESMIAEPSAVAGVLLMALPALLGVGALRNAGVRFGGDRLAFVAWTWPAGAFVLALIELACLLLGIATHHWLAVVAAVAIAVCAVAWRTRVAAPDAAAPPARPRCWGDVVFWCVVLLGALATAVTALAAAAEPCVIGDEGSLWAMKAKAFSYDWFHGDFGRAQGLSTHPDYPPLNPLLQAWSHALAGGFTLFANRVPIQLCTLSLWLATAAALRRRSPGWLAALLLLVLLLDPLWHAACLCADADTMVALGLVLGCDGWLRSRADDERGHRAVAALGLAFALWSKNEATLYFACAAIGAGLVAIAARTKATAHAASRRWPFWLALPLGVVVWQWGWNRWFHFQNDLAGGNPLGKSFGELFAAQFADRIGPVLGEGASLLVRWDRAHGVLLLVLLAPLLWPRVALARPLGVITLALLGAVLGTHLVYVGSWLELRYHLTTSHARVLFQLVPVSLLWFAAVCGGAERRTQGRPARVDSRSSSLGPEP